MLEAHGLFKYYGSVPALRNVSLDLKSTRLNSSHLVISYAVFCLKKKNYMVLTRDRYSRIAKTDRTLFSPVGVVFGGSMGMEFFRGPLWGALFAPLWLQTGLGPRV